MPTQTYQPTSCDDGTMSSSADLEAMAQELTRRDLAGIAVELARRHPADLAPLLFTIDTPGADGRPQPMKPEPFHVAWLDAAQTRDEVLLIAARGHAKSEYYSAVEPAWIIGTHPDVRIVHVTSTDDLATMYSRRLQAVVTSARFREVFPQAPGRGVKWTESEWELDVPGVRDPTWRCAGRGSSITGGRADVIIADDVVTEETARSEVERRRTLDWWNQTLMPMLVPGGKLLVIGTRYNEADLYATLMEGGMEPLLYPAEDRKGRILWPSRFNREELDARKRPPKGSAYSYASQYLCKPVPAGGILFRPSWWRYYQERPTDLQETLISIDCAFEGEETSDFVCAQVWGRRWADMFLLDQLRERADFVATLRMVESLVSKWPKAAYKLVEKSANGPAVISALQHRIPGLVAVTPKAGGGSSDNSKRGRAQAIIHLIESGNVYLPTPALAPWIDDFLSEFSAFPSGAHSDQVDALTQALNHLLYEQQDAPPSPRDERPMDRTVESVVAMARMAQGLPPDSEEEWTEEEFENEEPLQ